MGYEKQINVVLLVDQDGSELAPCYEFFSLCGPRAKRLLAFLREGGSDGFPPAHCPVVRGPGPFARQYQSDADELALGRFEYELKVIALLVGPRYRLLDAVRSIYRLWLRYFNKSPIPRGYGSRIYPSLREVARSGQIYNDQPEKYVRDVKYDMSDQALYELVAMIMYEEWYRLMPVCPVPFEYPEIARDRPPPGDYHYTARFPFQCESFEPF